MSFMCVSCEFSATKPLGERETLIEQEFLFKSLLGGDPYDRHPLWIKKPIPTKVGTGFIILGSGPVGNYIAARLSESVCIKYVRLAPAPVRFES